MRDINRIQPTLDAVKELWLTSPDLRLGQLLCWIAGQRDPFAIEDDKIIESCKKLLKD